MKYISLLRGINVGGRNKIKMADLKSLYEDVGLAEVETYIQSGNVVFKASNRNASSLRELLEQSIGERFGFDVPVVLRTHEQLVEVMAKCPFGEINVAAEGSRVFVVFLGGLPDVEWVGGLGKYVAPPEELVVDGCEVYLRCPDGYGKSKLNNAFVGRKLGVTATVRNWKTIGKLVALSG